MRPLLASLGLLVVTATGAVAQGDPSAKEVLIETVPGGYELSPESAGVTGEFDLSKAQQFGLPTEMSAERLEIVDEGYFRIWAHRDGGDLVSALVLKGTDEAAATNLFNGAIQTNKDAGRKEFEVDVPGARGFTEVSADTGQVVHFVAFRQGVYSFSLGTVGEREKTPELAIRLAQTQFQRAREGETTSELVSEPQSPADLSAQRSYSLGRLTSFVIFAAAAVFAVSRLRRSRPTAPHPGPDPAIRDEEPTRLEYHGESLPTHPPPGSDEQQPPVA